MDTLYESFSDYCLQFQISTGKLDNKSGKGLGLRVVLDLISSCFERRHPLYFDNLYTSTKLLLESEKHNSFTCGSVSNNRGQFPTKFKDNIEVSESVFIRSPNLLMVHWKDKRDVYVMSTIHNNGVTEIQRKRGDKVTK